MSLRIRAVTPDSLSAEGWRRHIRISEGNIESAPITKTACYQTHFRLSALKAQYSYTMPSHQDLSHNSIPHRQYSRWRCPIHFLAQLQSHCCTRADSSIQWLSNNYRNPLCWRAMTATRWKKGYLQSSHWKDHSPCSRSLLRKRKFLDHKSCLVGLAAVVRLW